MKGEVFDRELHWVRAVTLHPDFRVSQLIQYAREIVIEPRTQDELYESIPAEGDETEILIARVHRASGGVALAEEQKSEGGRPSIRWPDLKTGDVVEVVLRTWTSSPVGGAAIRHFTSSTTRAPLPRTPALQRGGRRLARRTIRSPSTCCTASPIARPTKRAAIAASCA